MCQEQGGSALNNVGMYRAFDEFGFVKEEDGLSFIVQDRKIIEKYNS